MQDVWLLKLDAAAVVADALRRELQSVSSELRSWQAMDGALTYIYVPAHFAPLVRLAEVTRAGVEWQRLACVQDLDGASSGEAAPFHYVVETDVLPQQEEDLNAWYSQEHLPGLAAVPGTVRAARYVDAAGSPRYYACYDLMSPDTLGSPPWLAVRATAWTSRVRSAFRNTRRTMFRRTPS